MADKPFPDLARMYRGSIAPEVSVLLDEITKPPHDWSFQKFKNSLVAMAVVSTEERHYLPARNRPESIDIKPLRKYIDEIRRLTNESGREFGRVFFVDTENQQFIAGKKSEGTERQVLMDWSKPGDNQNLRRLFSVHGHPSGPRALAHGMSGADYSNFITNRSEMFKVIVWDDYTMLALKTSVTPNGLLPKRVDEKIEELNKEVFGDWQNPVSKIVDFNRLVCLEFGMMLYLADKSNKDVVKRVNVV